MNTPKISLKIIRHEYVKNLLGDSYDDVHNPFPEVVDVGTYTLAHIESMQENLSQEKDVTEHMKNLNAQWFDSISLVSLGGDEFNKDGLNETT
jgi:hypothetical protein